MIKESKITIEKDKLEKMYLENTNAFCCYTLEISQVTLLKWLDKYEIKKKGSPSQNRKLDHKKICSLWFLNDGQWSRVTDFNGQYLFQGQWENEHFFIDLPIDIFPRKL